MNNSCVLFGASVSKLQAKAADNNRTRNMMQSPTRPFRESRVKDCSAARSNTSGIHQSCRVAGILKRDTEPRRETSTALSYVELDNWV